MLALQEDVLEALQRICLIIDFDGFDIGGKFSTREFGGVALTHPRNSLPFSHYFSVEKPIKDYSEKDWKTICYTARKVHGLSLFPRRQENASSQDWLPVILKQVWDSCKTPECDLVAYKGGHYERDMLSALNIPHFNLENAGCPKADCLPPLEMYACEHHLCAHHLKFHCPREEVAQFRDWVRMKIVEATLQRKRASLMNKIQALDKQLEYLRRNEET